MIHQSDRTIAARDILIDMSRNTLSLLIPAALDVGSGTPGTAVTGLIDIGAGGRLLGIEVGDTYIVVADPQPDTEFLGRTVEMPVTATTVDGEAAPETRLTFARRGPGYELSFPSGNQCWTLQAPGRYGRPVRICSVLADR